METLVTCDSCGKTSEAGWGDHPTCLTCTPADEVCQAHQRTFVGSCPLCDLDAEEEPDDSLGPEQHREYERLTW